MTEKYARVKLGEDSVTARMTTQTQDGGGVHQGSSLNPLLFAMVMDRQVDGGDQTGASVDHVCGLHYDRW